MRKRLFTALLAALLIASFAALPACSGDPQEPASSEGAMTTPSTGEVTAGEESTSPSDVTGQETQTQAESNGTTGNTTKAPAGNTTRRTTARTTKRTNQSGGDLIYTIPEDKNEIFPSNWTPTSKVTDIPANLKANVKSGKVNILTAAKMSEDERMEVSATFKKLTGQNLELTETVVDWLSLSSTLQTMVMAKNAPDVFYIYNGVAHYLRNKGLTRNINDYINMNDAVWKSQQDLSKVMYYDKKLTGAVVDTSLAGNGFSYDKRYLDGLTDPYTLYQQGKWDINTFMEYAEELTKRSGNTTTRYGVSCTTACILRMGLAMGKDIVEINDDGSYSSNLNSNVWTRYAGYARRINDFGSIDPYTVTDSKFGTGRVVLKESAWYANSLNENTIALKKAGQVGWVPFPRDPAADKYYHCVESNIYMLPESSKNPWGGAGLIYSLRYQEEARDPAYAAAEKQRYLDAGYTSEEYDYFTKGIYEDITPVYCNWQNMPNFNYTDLQNIHTESWSVVRERVKPKLDSAIAAQNK